ncbi:MAG: porin [Alphaproteobacteria bacterium]|nr:porin [Alphaproteobacteria bacterium]
MKKLLLSSVAVLGLTAVATSASANGLSLDLGGHLKAYGVISSQDEAAGVEARGLDMLQETELHFGGETTLDNGLTVGVHVEAETDGNDAFAVDESYAYFAGSWGRVNVGNEDGAAYLLQVAAPSADSNVDGIRQFVQPVNGLFPVTITSPLDYANDGAADNTGDANKLTYLSPIMNGFQAGLTYTPDIQDGFRDLDGVSIDDRNDTLGTQYEVAARYEGMFNNVGFIFGAGYTMAELETDTGANADDFDEWNVGLDLDLGAFGLGVVYTENNNGQDNGDDNETLVVGADYTTGPFKLGVSYLTNDNDAAITSETDTDRYTGGVVYSYGPGMSFRGSISYLDMDNGPVDADSTSVLLGTQINF